MKDKLQPSDFHQSNVSEKDLEKQLTIKTTEVPKLKSSAAQNLLTESDPIID